MKNVFFAATIALGSLFVPQFSQAQVRVAVRPAPPARILVARPAAPGPNYRWVDGNWRWNARQNRYIWVDGYWSAPNKRKSRGRALIVRPRG